MVEGRGLLGEFVQGKRYRVRPCFGCLCLGFVRNQHREKHVTAVRGRKLVLSDDRMWSIVCSARAACPHSWRQGDLGGHQQRGTFK
jgi:hypothetical protein